MNKLCETFRENVMCLTLESFSTYLFQLEMSNREGFISNVNAYTLEDAKPLLVELVGLRETKINNIMSALSVNNFHAGSGWEVSGGGVI